MAAYGNQQQLVPAGQPPTVASRLEAVETRRYHETAKNSYKIRRLEGRPQHGQLSMAIMFIGMLTWLGNVFVLVFPYWRSTWVGIFGYPRRRSWGVLFVSGDQTVDYWTMQLKACNGYADLNVGNICFSPICQWYRLKCLQYYWFYALSMSVASCFILILILHTTALLWTYRLSPRMIRWATMIWPLLSCLQAGSIATWFIMSEDIFMSLNAVSFYPTPPVGGCMYMALMVGAGLLTNSILSCSLRSMWPEPDSDTEEDSSDESDDEQEKRQRRQQQQQRPAQYPAQLPPGYYGPHPQAYYQQGGYPGGAYAAGPAVGYPAGGATYAVGAQSQYGSQYGSPTPPVSW